MCFASDRVASISLNGDADARLSANASEAQAVIASSLDKENVITNSCSAISLPQRRIATPSSMRLTLSRRQT